MGTATDMQKEMEQMYVEMNEMHNRHAELLKKWGAMEVSDYELKDTDGNSIKLSELFGDKDDLILVHNMGKSCPYCTLWADGFIGFTKHLENRAAFVLTSPDEPSVMKEFTEGRGWNFKCYSAHGTDFVKDMGFEPEPGMYQPGFSTFKKDKDGKLRRIAFSYFGPGDLYASVWHFFNLLENGADNWHPKYEY
ncbi:MAG TPA: DUF899 family protein [bacterium]|jgi:predicted dithiol-disulfide oxidoreductase (DUF899 family)